MTAIFNTFTKTILRMLLAVFIGSPALFSCTNHKLEIQNNFPFELKVMSVPKDIAKGNRVEIRISIEPESPYTGTAYFIRYFQFEGQGTLQYYGEAAYLPNDLYLLKSEQFRLYYTSNSSVSQSFDIWVSDNFGNEKKLSFQFNSSD